MYKSQKTLEPPLFSPGNSTFKLMTFSNLWFQPFMHASAGFCFGSGSGAWARGRCRKLAARLLSHQLCYQEVSVSRYPWMSRLELSRVISFLFYLGKNPSSNRIRPQRSWYRCTSAQSEAARPLRDIRRIKVKRAEKRAENSQHEYSIKNVRRRRRSQN